MLITKSKIEQRDSKALSFYYELKKNADMVLTEGPYTVTNKTGVPPSGSKHDYMTIAPYWWPNPDTPDGLPYVRKDGEVNPAARNDYTDFIELRGFMNAVEVLGKAFYYSGEKKYADKAITLIRTWFIDPDTRMNPHLKYGQGIPGRSEGRPAGIIEFGRIRQVISTLEILRHWNTLDADTEEGVEIWFADYVNWLQTSEIGIRESEHQANPGTQFDAQLYSCLIYLEKVDELHHLMETVTKRRIDSQVEADGSQPHELQRSKSHSYHITNLAAFTRIAVMGEKVGIDLWNYRSPQGGSIKKAFEFLAQYIVSDKEWEYPQISSLETSKVRFAKLLLQAGEAFNEAEYVVIAQQYLSRFDDR